MSVEISNAEAHEIAALLEGGDVTLRSGELAARLSEMAGPKEPGFDARVVDYSETVWVRMATWGDQRNVWVALHPSANCRKDGLSWAELHGSLGGRYQVREYGA